MLYLLTTLQATKSPARQPVSSKPFALIFPWVSAWEEKVSKTDMRFGDVGIGSSSGRIVVLIVPLFFQSFFTNGFLGAYVDDEELNSVLCDTLEWYDCSSHRLCTEGVSWTGHFECDRYCCYCCCFCCCCCCYSSPCKDVWSLKNVSCNNKKQCTHSLPPECGLFSPRQ